MNDAAVQRIWAAYKELEERVNVLEVRLFNLDAQIRARLKEEAERRKALLPYMEENDASRA